MARVRISREVEGRILHKSRRRCAICFGLDGDTSRKEIGQIAHLNHDASDPREDNLVFLCLEHHEEYDSSTSQAKGITERELEAYRDELMEWLKDVNWPAQSESEKEPVGQPTVKDAQLYQLKVGIYRAVRDLLRTIIAEAKVMPEALASYSESTDETLFLLGSEAEEFVGEVFQKALRLRLVHRRMEHVQNWGRFSQTEWEGLVNEDFDLINWFGNQLFGLRARFAKFLIG